MKPVVVGIVGGSGSGKTTLARGLCGLTGGVASRLISQDHYYKGVPAAVPVDRYNFDEPEALDLDLLGRHVRTLAQGEAVEMPLYDFAGHCRQGVTERVEPAPLIIVEGLFLYTLPALCECMTLRFFVDVPGEERLRRRMLRDVQERGREPADIARQFTEQVEPMYRRHVFPTRAQAHHVLDFHQPGDRWYCEQVVRMWGLVETALRGAGAL